MDFLIKMEIITMNKINQKEKMMMKEMKIIKSLRKRQ
jgi:hypothetical protein